MVKKCCTYLNKGIKDKDSFTISSVQRKFETDEDQNNFKPGCDYLKKLLYGKKVMIEEVFRVNNKSGKKNVTLYVMDVIRSRYHNYTFIDVNGDEYEPYCWSNIYYYDDKKGYEREREKYELKIKEIERKKEELKLRYKDIDPYGEEDWENEAIDYSEKSFLFKIGDQVICKNGYQDGHNIGGRTGVIINKDNRGNGSLNGEFKTHSVMYQIKFDKLIPPLYWDYWVFEELLMLTDEEEIKKRNKRKEELRLRYKDVDPYGEEDWGDDMNESKINENMKPKFIYLNSIIIKYRDSIPKIEKELEDLLLGETCIWYTKSNTLKNMVINSIEVTDSLQVILNGISTNKDMKVEIVHRDEDEYIVGIPSGEVIFLNFNKIKELKKEGLVSFDHVINNDIDYGWTNNFEDRNYYRIQKFLNPSYEKPRKNTETRLEYYPEDIVICQGSSELLDVDDRIGKIIDLVKKPKENEYTYLIEFMFKFNPMLHNGRSATSSGTCWWVKKRNIKGLYKGDMNLLKALQEKEKLEKIRTGEVEEHEIDDIYHINQLFKNKKNENN